MVVEDNQTIASAARRLGLKPSTARMILNKYKDTGTYPMKHFKKPIKKPSQKASSIKVEANEERFGIQRQDNHLGAESMR